MSALEQVLKGYGCFKEGDIEGLAALCHEDMVFRINGTHSLSGEYHGFSSWLNDFLAKIPTVIPGFISKWNIVLNPATTFFATCGQPARVWTVTSGTILLSRMERFGLSTHSTIPSSGPQRSASNFLRSRDRS